MDDNERIERLTELARRVYGNDAVVEPIERLTSDQRGWGVRTYGCSHMQVMGLRALDALEAALLVMAAKDPTAGEAPDDCYPLRRHLVQYAALVKVRADMAGKELLVVDLAAALANRAVQRQTAWVEQLAAEWESFAERFRDSGWPGADLWDRCAAELRERARGGERG